MSGRIVKGRRKHEGFAGGCRVSPAGGIAGDSGVTADWLAGGESTELTLEELERAMSFIRQGQANFALAADVVTSTGGRLGELRADVVADLVSGADAADAALAKLEKKWREHAEANSR